MVASCDTFEKGLQSYNGKKIFINNSVFLLSGENELFTYPIMAFDNKKSNNNNTKLKFSNFMPNLIKFISNVTFLAQQSHFKNRLDYRIIVLKKDIIQCLHRICTITKDCAENNINQRLDYLATGLKLIETQLLSIDATKWILIDTNDFVEQGSQYGNILTKFFNFNNQKVLTNVLNKVHDLFIQNHEKKMSAMKTESEQLSNIAQQYWDQYYAKLDWPIFGNDLLVAKP